MKITRDELVARLKPLDQTKPVCFCGDPRGLTLHRLKGRGSVVQVEFSEQVFRDPNGRLVIEHISYDSSNPEEYAWTVGRLVESLEGGPNLPVQFGGSEDVLSFINISDCGKWVSIDFQQRVTSGANGVLNVEETRDGKLVTEKFAASETTNPSESNSGAFAAIERQRPQ